MEDFSNRDLSNAKQNKKNLLLTSKDPHLSHLFGDDPRTPNSVGPSDQNSQSVMEDSGQFHDDESGEPEYRLFEQSYVPDLSPGSQIMMDSGNCNTINNENQGMKEQDPGIIVKETLKSDGTSDAKPHACKEKGSEKEYSDARSLHKHTIKFHASDANNNSIHGGAENERSERTPPDSLPIETAIVTTPIAESSYSSNANHSQSGLLNNHGTFTINLDSNTANHTGVRQNGPIISCQQRDDQSINKSNDTSALSTPGDNSNYNMQLLALSAQQHLQQQQAIDQPPPHSVIHHPPNGGSDVIQSTASNFMNQSSSALQQLAMRVQMRSTNIPQQTMSSSVSTVMSAQHYLPANTGQITGVRAQLRKSLSSSGKLESVNTRDWPRLDLGSNLGQSMGVGNQVDNLGNMYKSQTLNDPANIDNAPLLKDLLGANRRPSADKMNGPGQDGLPNNSHFIHGSMSVGQWHPNNGVGQNPNEQLTSPLQSPSVNADRQMFQYRVHQGDPNRVESSPIPNPSPMNSPTFPHPNQFPSQTTPLPQNNAQQFFSPNDIMVNNNNNQQMQVCATSSPTLNEVIAESETLVQDLIDAANASSNQENSLMNTGQMSYVQGGQNMSQTVRATPPPAYHLNPDLLGQDMSNQGGQMTPQGNIFMGQNGNEMVKSEPPSPMLKSPIGQRMFFNTQRTNQMGHHQPNMQGLGSPGGPHSQSGGIMQPAMQPTTPTGDVQWQYPSHSQNYVGVPQSPTAMPQVRPGVLGQDNLNQGVKSSMSGMPFSNRPRPPSGNPKPTRTRRTSGGSARKNPDGTLSCAICGHSFRSVPALNGHMRVHSSSSDKKNKDERQRKASGSSTGGSESKTPQSLSSPTTPTFKISTQATMYQNAITYNNVTFTNPPPLYNPQMESTGAMAAITQNDNARNPQLVHRIAPQVPTTTLYPHGIPHPSTMNPHDALLAAANFLARSERIDTDFMYRRSPATVQEYQKAAGQLASVPDLQNIHYIAQQPNPPKLDISGAYGKTPPQGMILVQPQPGVLPPGYLPQHQAEQLQVSNIATMPFVTISSTGASLPVYRPNFVSSPHQEQANPTAMDNLYLTVQQPLVQQSSHRSTPLADFADIAVAHNQGQLFCSNSMLVAPLSSNQLQQAGEAQAVQQQQQQQNEPAQHNMQDVSSDVGLMASVSKDLLYHPDGQNPALAKMDRDSSLPLKDDDFLPSTMAEIHNKLQPDMRHNQQNDPFIFPVSVPVQCSRDESCPTTITVTSGYGAFDYSSHMSSYHDDPLMQEAINVANPSKILPNSMMGGNPSGPTFRSFRQRHHSEGSVLKKILHTDVPCMPSNDDLKLGKMDFSSNFEGILSKTSPLMVGSNMDSDVHQKPPVPIAGAKRKNESNIEVADAKKLRGSEIAAVSFQQVSVASTESQVAPEKKEVWTVPKHAPPVRTRHRRHSADSRVPYRTGSLLSRSYLSSFTPGTNRHVLMDEGQREKRRPPPLIIPASVNAFTNGTTRYTSHLHHRRRPSGESTSSTGNEKIPPYTPPPMLSPLRFGTGLFHTTPITPQRPFRQASFDRGVIDTIPEEEDEELVRSADPKINIGTQYQAVLPDLLPRSELSKDVHKAELIWKPPAELQKNTSVQSRHVEEYMKLACSAAVPHGGCNKEFALHLLYLNNGNIIKCVQQLLTNQVMVPKDHWMSAYTYTGSFQWPLKERQNFDRAYMQHHKDFFMISKLVKTMSTSQCVDYYYHTIKRRKRRIQRPRRFRHDSDGENPLTPSRDDSDSYPSDDDFMRDLENEPIHLIESQESISEHKTVEIVRRSPTVTAFVRAPQPTHVVPLDGSRSNLPALIDYSPHIKREKIAAPAPAYPRASEARIAPVQPVHHAPQVAHKPYLCKFHGCTHAFSSPQQLFQHQQTHKSMKPYLDRVNRASPSPANSPSSVASLDADVPAPVFSCPRCGKTFAKVKSRNAHMKTHGKHAQEKRKQKEEEARRKMEEAAAWRNRAQHQRILPPNPSKGKPAILQFHIPKPPGM